jgi:hypothetical protein
MGQIQKIKKKIKSIFYTRYSVILWMSLGFSTNQKVYGISLNPGEFSKFPALSTFSYLGKNYLIYLSGHQTLLLAAH